MEHNSIFDIKQINIITQNMFEIDKITYTIRKIELTTENKYWI